jgi:hypothetical protein
MTTNKELAETFLKKEKPFDIPFHQTSDYYAVLVDPRPLPILPFVIYNVMRNLGPKWNLCIFGSKLNRNFFMSHIKGRFCFIDSGIENFNEKTYSLFLRSPDFWERIPGENIIIFQWDSFMIKPFPHEVELLFDKYGYIGAFFQFVAQNNKSVDVICPFPRTFNMNGGFSFRKKSIMLRCIRLVSVQDIVNKRKSHGQNIFYFLENTILNEDVFFGNALYVLGLDLPTREECGKFCIQNDWGVETTCAIHGYQYTYIPTHVLKKFLSNSI